MTRMELPGRSKENEEGSSDPDVIKKDIKTKTPHICEYKVQDHFPLRRAEDG